MNSLNSAPRINREEALSLLCSKDLLSLGRRANNLRLQRHPENIVTFVVDRNVNYTNVCESRCSFCAFYRNEHDQDAYILEYDVILTKVAELVEQGGTQLLMQGGLNPALSLKYFTDLFTVIKQQFPHVHIHSLSPAEVAHLAVFENMTTFQVIESLKESGLDSIPGGGAEILVDEVRQAISPRKIGWKQWKTVMLEAAQQGMGTTATMMFGSTERPEDIVEHLFRIREIQDEGGSFTAFIPWTYQPVNTELGGSVASGQDYLKVVALSRIVLDNIPNIQASWVTQGAKMAQVALYFGANDLGGTMLEENVVAAAGCRFRMSREEIIGLAKDAGFRVAQRTTAYELVKEFQI